MQTNLSAQEFAGKLLGVYTGGVLTKLIDIGYQTGLFEASVEGAATSDELEAEIREMTAPEPTGHGLPLSKCEAYNRVYDQRSRSS
jgi:uncharacterized protein YgfB (UPF0149 family)